MEFNMCRCCLAQGLHKNLSSTYTWCNKNVVYGNLLEECFNIVLMKYPNCSDGICESCIKALRTAVCLRRKVLNAEMCLVKKLCEQSEEKPEVEQEVKHEKVDSDDYFPDEIRDDDAPDNTPDAQTEENVKVEIEVLPEKKTAQRKSKKPPVGDNVSGNTPDETEAKKVKVEVEVLPAKRKAPTRRKRKQEKVPTVWDLERLKTKLAGGGTYTQGDIKISKPPTVLSKFKLVKTGNVVKRTETQAAKHRENLANILQYSNALPFKSKNLLGYICVYCESTFPDPKDLRTHTTDQHQHQRLDLTAINKSKRQATVKVDITDLKCTMCEEEMTNLTHLKEHLVKIHNKTIHNDIKDVIMPFKLKKGEEHDCLICPATYETFKMLTQHMNKHFDNYICDICSTAFSTNRALSSHKITHKDRFKCIKCEKVFPTFYKLQYHAKTQHLGAKVKNCPHCDESFGSYYQKNQHMIKVHNEEPRYKCNICDQAYILKTLLTQHIKRIHLMERNNQCSECGYRCFSKKTLKEHMVKHTDEKKYACTYCDKAYSRRKTLAMHIMRIHNNDRRFKCELCGKTYFQNCNLKKHLMSNHGIHESEIFNTDTGYQAELIVP